MTINITKTDNKTLCATEANINDHLLSSLKKKKKQTEFVKISESEIIKILL